ncbi:hypothetical protein [Streptomyces klenkii]
MEASCIRDTAVPVDTGLRELEDVEGPQTSGGIDEMLDYVGVRVPVGDQDDSRPPDTWWRRRPVDAAIRTAAIHPWL